MKTNFILPRFLSVALIGVLFASCTADDNEMPMENRDPETVEVAFETQAKVGDSMKGNENEPIIVIPPRRF